MFDLRTVTINILLITNAATLLDSLLFGYIVGVWIRYCTVLSNFQAEFSNIIFGCHVKIIKLWKKFRK